MRFPMNTTTNHAPTPHPAAPLTYSIIGAAEVLGVGRSTVYELLASGELAAITIGRRRLVIAASLIEFIERRMTAAAA